MTLNRRRKGAWRGAALTLCIAILTLFSGCDALDTQAPEEAVLIRSDRRTVTKGQFERAFETAKIAYSDNRSVDPQQLERARMRMLDQMTEELIIERRADELGIAIDDQALQTAIQDLKKDYPDDEFEQMLLESAIPYSLWKDRLRVRLLMEKVIDQDLAQSVIISAQDIEDYYKAHEAEFAVDQEKPPEADLKHRIVEQLRREKVETAYPQWMDGLRKRYQVEINWELWAATTGPDTKAADRAED